MRNLRARILLLALTFLSIGAVATNGKFKSGDCLFFEADALAGSISEGAVWKILGVKDNKYIVRLHGGKGMALAKPDAFTASGWARNAGTLSFENTDKDGTKVQCPKE